MSVTAASAEDESFIILGSSPGASLLHAAPPPFASLLHDTPSRGSISRSSGPEALQLDDAMKDFSKEASLAFKAHFHLSDTPSPSSMLTACSLVTDEHSTVELQTRFAELLDENVILKETLRTNNDSLRDKFLLIASCQEDVMRTHKLHQDKFCETKELVERLRTENRKLKDEIKRVSGGSEPAASPPTSAGCDAAADLTETAAKSLAYEFVASPDEDTLQKLTSQLELVEKQRRQVIVENEKLTWQKESLEHIVDVTSKERNELRGKLNNIELDNLKKESALQNEIQSLKSNVQDLEMKLQQAESLGSTGGEEMMRRDNAIRILEAKVSSLQQELKNSQLKILHMEDLKLEVSRLRTGGAEVARQQREQAQALLQRLHDAQTTVFQPMRLSLSSECEPRGAELAGYVANVKLYDKSLKHLAELLNTLTQGASEGLAATLELAVQAAEARVEQSSLDALRAGLARLRSALEAQHGTAVASVGQVRATIAIFEKIFEDYKEVLKNQKSASSEPVSSHNMDALTAALVSRDQELQLSAEELSRLRATVATLQKESDEREHLRAQCEVFRVDFEAERESRQKLASDKESIMSDLRGLQRRNQTLTEQLEEVRRLNPNIFNHAKLKRVAAGPHAAASPSGASAAAPAAPAGPSAPQSMVYTCPKCQTFRCDQYKQIEDHVERCLDQ